MHDIRPFLSELFTKPGTLLYIGARPDAKSWVDEFIEAGNTVTILEIWTPNAHGLMKLGYEVVIGDVRQFTSLAQYDYVVWWHGPEHVSRNEMVQALHKLYDMSYKALVVACPYGRYVQGAHEGNVYETHQHHLYPEDFEELGFQVRTDGIRDVPGGEIVAWVMK